MNRKRAQAWKTKRVIESNKGFDKILAGFAIVVMFGLAFAYIFFCEVGAAW